MFKLPAGVLAELTVYLVTEINNEEIDLTVSFKGLSAIPEIQTPINVEELVRSMNSDVQLDFTKTRLMTVAEICEYRRSEKNNA